jgi:glycosyltransferase involved in cell wall biosynthesis
VNAAGIVVGIDASRNRSGGAIRHLVGILGACDPQDHGVSRVHVWSYKRLLEALPDAPWLVKHSPPELRRSLLQQLWWQRRLLPREAERAEIDILLNTDAGTVCRARPAVTMSRDMLSYEPREMRRYVFSRMWLRLLALKYVQSRSLADADGAVFLTNYAAETIQRTTGALRRVAVIPHGVDAEFRRARNGSTGGRTRCLYVSQADMYKHQWHVVRAIRALRDRGHDVTLLLAGGGEGRPQRRLEEEIRRSDPAGEFVEQRGVVPAGDLPALLAEHDVFVFASSCENMPNTLIEAMASGLTIACADRGPMPEVLRDGGLYFDPEDAKSIADAVEQLLRDRPLRERLARRAAALAADYSWERCAAETWAFLRATHRDARGGEGRGA